MFFFHMLRRLGQLTSLDQLLLRNGKAGRGVLKSSSHDSGYLFKAKLIENVCHHVSEMSQQYM